MLFNIHAVDKHNIDYKYEYDNQIGYLRGPTFHINPETSYPLKPMGMVELIFGFNCNNDCSYCDQSSTRNSIVKSKKYDAAYIDNFCNTAAKYINEYMSDMEHIHFAFWGGETLLYINYIREMYKHLNVMYPSSSFSIITNGKLLKNEIFDWIKDKSNLVISISHDGKYTKLLRNYDPFDDDLIVENATCLLNEHRLVISPVVTKYTYSRKTVVDYIEHIFRQKCRFGDFKFILPVNKHVHDNYCVPENDLEDWMKREYTDLLTTDISTRSYINNIERKIYRSLNKVFRNEYPRNIEHIKNLVIHIDGTLTWSHSQSKDQTFPNGEPCAYGNIFDKDVCIKPDHVPSYISNYYVNNCLKCPVLAYGDRGCTCLMQYPGYERYYCKTQIAKLLPIFGKVFKDMTGKIMYKMQLNKQPIII